MRRTIISAVAVIALTGAAGCGAAEDAAQGAADQAQSAAEEAAGQAQSAAGDAASQASDAAASAAAGAGQQVQQQVDQLLEANPIVFTPESAELTGQSGQTLQQIGAALAASGAGITVVTHSGYEDAAQAQELSEMRAEAISQALQAAGVSADQITTEAKGNTVKQGAEALETGFQVSP